MRFGGPGPLQLRTLQRSAPAVGSTVVVDTTLIDRVPAKADASEPNGV